MTRSFRTRNRLVVVFGVLGIFGATWAAAVRAAPDDAPPRYVPPDLGAPTTRVAAASRGSDACTSEVVVLAPPHTGLTRAATPTVWWHLAADCGHPVEITLLDTTSFTAPPLLEQRLAPPPAGFHATTLAPLGARLEPGRDYRFNVAVVVDSERRSSDVFASATLRRVAEDAAGSEADAHALAAAGLWFDAIDAVMRAGDDAAARTARAALLTQVDLDRTARSDAAVHGP
jgi:hypothetical protein